jgi:hypothetical protein
MGCVGFRIAQKTIPPQLASVTPTYVARLSPDLLNLDRRQQTRKFQPFTFWVPIRDQKWDRRETPKPHDVTVAMIRGGDALGVAQQDVGDSIIDILELKVLGPSAAKPEAGIINASELTVDADRYRQHLQTLAAGHKWSAAQLKALELLLANFGRSNTTAENFDARYDQWFAENGAKTRESAKRVGLDVEVFTSQVKEIVRTLLQNETVLQSIENVKNGSSVREDEARKLMGVYIDTVMQQETVDKLLQMMRAFIREAEEALEAAGGPGLPNTVFKTTVGDDQFLLYSVGENGLDDRARLVGTYGTDILMWPPILSLQREARAAK